MEKALIGLLVTTLGILGFATIQLRSIGKTIQEKQMLVVVSEPQQETLGAPQQTYFRTLLPITTTSTIGNSSSTWDFVYADSVTSTFATTTNLNLSTGACTGGSALQVNATGLVSCGAVNATMAFGETWRLLNGALTPTTSVGIMVSPSSSFGGLVSFSSGLLSLASSTFSNGLNVSGIFNASSTALVQSLVGYTSSSFQNDLTVSRSLGVSSTFNATGFASLFGGLYSGASSSIGNALIVSGYLGASSTFGATGLSTLNGGFQSLASSSVNNDLIVSRYLGVSSTGAYSGFLELFDGLRVAASSSFKNDLSVSRNLMVSSSLYTTGLNSFFGGLLSMASSSFNGNLTAGNFMTSGTLAMGKNGYQQTTSLLRFDKTIPSATSSDIFVVFEADRAITLRGLITRIGCRWGCQGGAGIRYNFRHGSSFVPASTTAATVFDNDIISYSSTTAQSFCNTNALDFSCTFSPTFNDVTLAAGEALWLIVSSSVGSGSSTANIDLDFSWFYDHQ